MNPIQVKPLPSHHKESLPQLIRDFRAALSYVSFYSSDSPFVVQAVQKCHKNLQKIFMACGPLVIYREGDKLFINDANLSELDELQKIFQDKNVRGVRFTNELTAGELTLWMKEITSPVSSHKEKAERPSHAQTLFAEDSVQIMAGTEAAEPAAAGNIFEQPLNVPSVGEIPAPAAAAPGPKEVAPFSLRELIKDENFPVHMAMTQPIPDTEAKANEALLSFLAEAWQHAQLQRKSITAAPEMAALTQSFEKLFDRLLDRLEKASPEFSQIYLWFRTPQGELLENQVVSSMYPLLEVAVKNGWTAVLFDPVTEGLVAECLAHWGANGQQELVEKTVTCLAEALNSDPLEKQVALTHLMDARPWVRNPLLLGKVLENLNTLLANEITPGLYQTALLLAWDLMEPAMTGENEQQALVLLSTLHFHADEDLAAFPERARIARHWLFERSTPDLIRRFVLCAFKAGQLSHFPLLGEMAAPLLLEDFFKSASADKSGYLKIFAEMKEPVRSALAEKMADTQDEEEVKRLIPILRVSGMDPALSLQLSAWLSKGSRELKINLLGVIEEVGDPAGGPALRLAVFDDSEEIASMAARVIGRIHFTRGSYVLLKAAHIREGRFSNNDVFLFSVCQALGELAVPEGMTFLQDIARKKPLLRGKNFSLPVRLEAIQALAKINKPEVWHFLEELTEEKTPAIQETIDKIIHEKTGNLSQ